MEGVFEADTDFARVTAAVQGRSQPGENLEKHLEGLRKKMFDLAENLDFEEAANTRDEIKRLENVELEIGLDPFIRQRRLETLTEGKKFNKEVVPLSRSKGGTAGTRVIKGKIVKK